MLGRGGLHDGAQPRVAGASDSRPPGCLTNTSKFKHWLAGTILEAKKMTIDITLVP